MHHATDILSTPLPGRIRPGVRFYRPTTLLTVFAMLFGGLLFLLAPTTEARSGENAESSGSGTRYVWDGALNLRSGPSTSDEIITVMPDGAAVELTGESSNGFAAVVYNGMWGWAFAEFLGTGQSWTPAPEADTGGDSGWVPVGDAVTGSGFVSDGPLNLRQGPSTSYTILDVMPHGASLEFMGDVQSGFHPLRYNGTMGWSSAEFITVGGGETPAPGDELPLPGDSSDNGEADDDGGGPVPVPGTAPVGSAMVIDGALNLRSGPGTNYSVLAVMPDSAQISLLGDPRAGFYPVSYNGTTGWAFADYLSIGNAGTPTEPDPAPAPEEPAPAPDEGNGSSPSDDIVSIIYAAADEYGQPREDMLRVAQCESQLTPTAVNPSSGASGLFQFMPGTWLSTPYADQSIFDPVANARAAAWMWSVGRRNEWTCQ